MNSELDRCRQKRRTAELRSCILHRRHFLDDPSHRQQARACSGTALGTL